MRASLMSSNTLNLGSALLALLPIDGTSYLASSSELLQAAWIKRAYESFLSILILPALVLYRPPLY
jgi:hypothetical protein